MLPLKEIMKNNSIKHILTMVFVCIIVLVILLAVSKYLNLSTNYLLFGAILLCMVMHIWMMREHKGGHHE